MATLHGAINHANQRVETMMLASASMSAVRKTLHTVFPCNAMLSIFNVNYNAQ